MDGSLEAPGLDGHEALIVAHGDRGTRTSDGSWSACRWKAARVTLLTRLSVSCSICGTRLNCRPSSQR